MTEINLWALGSIGLAAGLLGSTLGVGGGIFIVPMLTLVLHLPIHIAIGNSLVAIVATSCTAASIYTKNRLTNVKLGLLLETATTPGAIVGGLAVALLVALRASSLLGALFGIVIIYVAYAMVTRRPLIAEDNPPEDNSAKPDTASTNSSSWLANSYYDQNLGKLVTYKVSHIPQGLGAGFFAGALSSLLGIGGGIVQVPIMNLVMGLPMKATIATSTFMIAITTTVGALIHYYHGYVYPIIVAPLIIGVFLGARLGAELTQRARGALLRRIFGVFLFITALLMFLQAVNIM